MMEPNVSELSITAQFSLDADAGSVDVIGLAAQVERRPPMERAISQLIRTATGWRYDDPVMQSRAEPAEIASRQDFTNALANLIELAHRAGFLWVRLADGGWMLVPQARFPVLEAGTPYLRGPDAEAPSGR